MRGYRNNEENYSRQENRKGKTCYVFSFLIIIALCVVTIICINGINQNTEQKDSLAITDEVNPENDSLINGHRYVDLGLSVMWADCNIGSDNPYNRGMLCGWADITGGKGSEDINDYPSANPPLNISGNSSYDIASCKWGKEWRLPTVREYRELLNKCEWIWIDSDDGCGYKITGPNGNSIFCQQTILVAQQRRNLKLENIGRGLYAKNKSKAQCVCFLAIVVIKLLEKGVMKNILLGQLLTKALLLTKFQKKKLQKMH